MEDRGRRNTAANTITTPNFQRTTVNRANTGSDDSEERARTLPAGSDPNRTTMVPVRSKPVPTPLSLEELKNLRLRSGAQRFPGGIRPARNMQLDKIREIQAKGLKFGNYADDKELFERMLENSDSHKNLAQGLPVCLKMTESVA